MPAEFQTSAPTVIPAQAGIQEGEAGGING